MKALRWIVFLPVGFVSAAALQVIPIIAFHFARDVEWKFTLLNVILAMFVASLVMGAIMWWFVGVFLTPSLSCCKIAPNNKIASVIFATLFIPLQGLAFVMNFKASESGWLIAYHAVFSLLLIAGCVSAYKEGKTTG